MSTDKLGKKGLSQVWEKVFSLVKSITGDVDVTNKGDLQAQIDGIDIGGRNYCRNNNYWKSKNTAVMQITNNDDGSVTIEKIADVGTQHCYLPFSEPLEIGSMYTITIKCKSNSTSSISPLCTLYDISSNHGTNITYDGEVSADEYTILTSTFTVTSYCDAVFTTSSRLNVGETIDIAWIKVEKGNKSTDWTPNPDDQKAIKRCSVGQTGLITNEKMWYKFASIKSNTYFDDRSITFKVSTGFGDHSQYVGILTAHYRTGDTKTWESGQLVWEYAGSRIVLDDFVIAYKNTDDTSCEVELWVRIPNEYTFRHFEVISEHHRTGFADRWDLYSISSEGYAESITDGYTQIASELLPLRNNAETATKADSLQLTRISANADIDANWLPESGSTSIIREYTKEVSNVPDKNFYHILCNRSTDTRYGSQLAIGMTTNALWFRRFYEEFGDWKRVAFTDSNVASATKLETARSVEIVGDMQGSFSFDGSKDVSLTLNPYYASLRAQNTNNYPYRRFATTGIISGNYYDSSGVFLVTEDFIDGGYGIFKIEMRTETASSTAKASVNWLIRKGLPADCIQVAIYNVHGAAYADAFYKMPLAYHGTVIRNLASGARANVVRRWILINSYEADDTTATDKKDSFESYMSIEGAGTVLHERDYSEIVTAVDGGVVARASQDANGNVIDETYLPLSGGTVDYLNISNIAKAKSLLLYLDDGTTTVTGMYHSATNEVIYSSTGLNEAYSSHILKIGSSSGNMYGSGTYFYLDTQIRGRYIALEATKAISSSVSIVTSSDEKVKSFTDDIETDEEKLVELFDIIKPKSYNYKYSKADSLSIGFSAQEIEQAMIDLDIDPEKYGILNIQYGHMLSRGDDEEDGKYYTKFYEISYNDLFNLSLLKMHVMEKEHVARLESIEKRLTALENK